jgi:hypothetical protein
MSLAVDVEIESMDTVVRRCMQALIDCGATGCFIDIEWAKLNNIPMHPLTKLIPVYNIDSTVNDASMITDITDVILQYENHSERTQLAVTRLGKQSMILGLSGELPLTYLPLDSLLSLFIILIFLLVALVVTVTVMVTVT